MAKQNTLMEIILKGNKESYQLSNKYKPLEITLFILNDDSLNSPINVKYGDEVELKYLNGSHFFQFAEKIRGASKEKIANKLIEYNLSEEFSRFFLTKNEIEVSLFKSVFLIFIWVEVALTDAYAVSIDSKIYNEFIVDYSGKPESQNDIYFVNKDIITNENIPYIEKLIEVNLLVSVLFRSKLLGEYQTYIIPLIKPGVSREYFKHSKDPAGEKTYSFWKKILADRNDRLSYWFKNKF